MRKLPQNPKNYYRGLEEDGMNLNLANLKVKKKYDKFKKSKNTSSEKDLSKSSI